MRILLIIFILISFNCKGQTTYDTVPRLIPVINSKVNSNHIINGNQLWLVGYVIYKTVKTDSTYVTNKIGYLKWDRKNKIPATYLVNKLNEDMPVNGYDFRP